MNLRRARRAGGRCVLAVTTWTVAAACIAALIAPSLLWAETATLKNGLAVEGSVGHISGIGGNPLAGVGAGEVKLKQVVLFDNQLTRTFVATKQLATPFTFPPAPISEKFLIKQRVAVSGRTIGGVGPIVRITPFDEFGRRIFTMRGPDGNLDIVQGITEITPVYTKVEAVQGAGNYIWTMRIATSSIPREILSKILSHHIDVKKSDDRLRIVRLYLQSERIQDARAELEQLIKDFPDLAALNDQVKSLHQVGAQRVLKEVELRQAAGQYKRAIAVLEAFPPDGVAGETLLKVREMLEALAEQKAQGDRVGMLLAQHLAALKDDAAREAVQPVVDEIVSNLNINTLDRMADYLRLADDAALSPEQKLSYAISGWLMGSGAGVDNLLVSKSLYEVRGLVREYLASTRKPDRDILLTKLESLEGATPAYVAKVLAHMKPPLSATVEPEAPVDPGDPAKVLGLPPEEAPSATAPAEDAPAAEKPAAEPPLKLKVVPREAGGGGGDGPEKTPPAARSARAAPAAVSEPKSILDGAADAGPFGLPRRDPTVKPAGAAEPAAPAGEEPAEDKAGPVTATGVPGLFELTVRGLPEDPQIKYWVQLPPEYDPYRRYPCIVTLNGAGTTPQQQIDWWAGAYNSETESRYGQASRHGYIVLAPRWAKEHQSKYEYSAREHAAALYTLRDACKRFAIDTDRVFLSGHSMGGDAAWDLGLSHPDVWAGVIPIVATADKYVTRYWKNGQYVSFYFVCGEKDGNKMTVNTVDWDRYLTHTGYDTMIVQYQGRGHEHFHDEIQRIFDWMNLHKRNFFPREFEVNSLRPWDNFFWWVEVGKFKDANTILPAEWGMKKATAAEVTGDVLTTNAVTVSGGEDVTVWLAPEIVSFDSRVTATINGKRHLNIQPSVATMLEDARTRGDRLHPFWAKVQN
jgi:predicted esterase